MGQAKNRGSKEERIAQAKARNATESVEVKPKASSYTQMDWMMANQMVGSLFNNLTTPASIDENVVQFAKMVSDKEPMFMTCEPEPWSKQGCCDMNVEKYIEKHGGKMLCGYRVWYNAPDYIEGERHAVWTDGTIIRDVSFCDSGEQTIVFVPDDRGFEDAAGKVRHTFIESRQAALAKFHEIDQALIQHTTAEQAWEMMPTYEQWQAGARSTNMFVALS
jgi:hypothetical protein